ncbi:hypothetical protein [Pseudomonas sp. MAG002Y]|uniref:hypothetical protein n=1 Tax=Pseudomonas sp. MAG002Y TaxID=2678690 RepID=UPI001C60C741|nr:hypothetical protein [Pseudomonas sp. MAG002Y]MBW5415509.1 hypothetical protein [Pseudomonas sp. MAG002Y]
MSYATIYSCRTSGQFYPAFNWAGRFGFVLEQTTTSISDLEIAPLSSNVVSIKPDSLEDQEQLEAQLSFLQKASLRLMHRNGTKATLLVLERWKTSGDEIQIVFTPGVVEALGSLEGRELLKAAMNAATA